MSKVVVIAGPTASGKSGLAVELAKKINGEIISADSVQVYKYMDIGSAKVTKEENTDEARKKFNVFLICMIPVPLIGFIFLLIGLRSFL